MTKLLPDDAAPFERLGTVLGRIAAKLKATQRNEGAPVSVGDKPDNRGPSAEGAGERAREGAPQTSEIAFRPCGMAGAQKGYSPRVVALLGDFHTSYSGHRALIAARARS